MMEKNHRPTGLARVSEGKGHRRRDRQISKETFQAADVELWLWHGSVSIEQECESGNGSTGC